MKRFLASLTCSLALVFFVQPVAMLSRQAGLLPMPKAQFFNVSGLALSGGRVYTYVTGTSTPLASFTDATASVANLNPVVLDSAGRGNIWLLRGRSYRIVVKTSVGATVSVTDNVIGVPGALPYVTDFGALCNGSTNDASAFQTAANAIASAGGGPLLVPGGKTCVINSSLTTTSAVLVTFESNAVLQLGNSNVILCNFSGDLTQHFIYGGSGVMQACSSNPLTNTFAPEWWGAKADNSTASLNALYAASQALPAHSRLQLQPGIYVAGATAAKPCMWPESDDIEIFGAGQFTTSIRYTSSYQNSNVLGGCLFFGDQTHSYTTTRSTLYIHDFGILDNNTGGAFSFAGINPSAFTGVFVTNITVENMYFSNCKGNACITLIGKNAAQTDNGENWFLRHTVFEGTSAGGWIEFSGVNAGGFGSGSYIDNRCIGASQTCLDVNSSSTVTAPAGFIFSNNFADMKSRGNSQASCFAMGPGRGNHIEHNTCVNIGANGLGVMLSQESGDPTLNKYYDTWISDNEVYASSFSSTIGISVAAYEADGIHVTGNKIRASVPFTGDIRPLLHVNGPGLRTTFFTGNNVDCGAGNCKVFDLTQSQGTFSMSSTIVMDVSRNIMTNVGSTAKVVDFAGIPSLKSASLRLYDNLFESAVNPRDSQLGMPWFALGLPVAVSGGTSASVSFTYSGALPGDDCKLIGLNDGSGFTALPAGVAITSTSTTADTVRTVVTNTSGSNFDPTAGNTPLIVCERRR